MAALPVGEGRTIVTVADWVRAYLNQHWRTTWVRNLAGIERAYERAGDPAYGIYGRALCHPIASELVLAGLACGPPLPGSFELSEEVGESSYDRERRFWSVVCEPGGEALGALVTRWFHDHTRLRIPRPPEVLALVETDPWEIRRILARPGLAEDW